MSCDKHVDIKDIKQTKDRDICLEEFKVMIQINESGNSFQQYMSTYPEWSKYNWGLQSFRQASWKKQALEDSMQFVFVIRKNESLHAGSKMQYTQKLIENGL